MPSHPQYPDDQIKACAASGGVVGIVGVGGFLGDPQAKTETLFRHLDHVVNLVGPEHVAIGTDYVRDMESLWPLMDPSDDSPWRDPYGTQIYAGICFQPEQLPELVGMMADHGYPDAAIRGILGGNMKRVYRAVQENLP